MWTWDQGLLSADFAQVSVAVTSSRLVDGSPNRYALIVSSTNAGRVTIAPGYTAVLDQGMNIPTSVLPLVMTYAQFGEMVRRPWAIIGSAAGTVGVIEVLYG